MAVYVIVIAAAVLLLVFGYRALGGAQSRSPSPAALLTSALGALRANLAELDQLLPDPDGQPVAPTDGALRAGRRGAAAIQHHVDLLPGGDGLEEVQASLAVLVAAAAEDLSWAWRLLAAPGWQDKGGVLAAVLALRDHATRCAEQAAPLLAVAPVAEPVERA